MDTTSLNYSKLPATRCDTILKRVPGTISVIIRSRMYTFAMYGLIALRWVCVDRGLLNYLGHNSVHLMSEVYIHVDRLIRNYTMPLIIAY